MDPKLQEAIAMEGYLGKQSPDMFHRYQQRYIKFLDQGLTLGYSDSKESFAHGKINGQIPLKDVIEVGITDSNPKKFKIDVEGRTYKFEAKTAEECAKWTNAVKLCREHAIHQEQKHKEQVLAIDSDIRFEETATTEEAPPETGFNPVGFLTDTAKKLIVGTAVKTGVTVMKTGVNVVGHVIGANEKKPTKTNEEHLKAKHLDEALSQINEKILQSRVMMGYLLKERKEATGVDLVDEFVNDAGLREQIATRWFFLISSKPIVFDHVESTDEETLDNGCLPFDIEQDVVYMYDDKCDDSKPLKSIYLKDVIDVVVLKKATSEQFYRFRLDLGDRKINLLTTNNTDMMNWIKAIQASRANLKEKARSKLPVIKNLYWHFKILADEGEDALREKIDRDYDRIVPSGDVMRADNIVNLIKIQEKVADELIQLINACLCHKDDKTGVIKIAMETYHESILNTLRNYFQKNQSNLENRDIFEIGKFLFWYHDKIKTFGDAFADRRISNGTATISKIVGTRILKTNLKPVKNIIKQDMDKEPELNGAGKAVSNAPTDIFKILNETFNILPLCNTKEMAFALLETCAHTIEYFISGLGTIIEYYKTTPDQLAAFCNNTISYNNSLKDFNKQAKDLTHAAPETIAQYFDDRNFSKSFITLGKKAYERLAREIFSASIGSQWNNTSFLDLSLRTLDAPLEKVRPLIEKMHNNFGVKVEAACLEQAVTFYIQAFLASAEKKRFNPHDKNRIADKFEYDKSQFADIFSNLKKGVIDSYTEPISNFHNFLASNYSFLPITVQAFKEEYGSAIKWSTIAALIQLRDDDIDKTEKAELLKNCEDIYRTSEKKADKAKGFNVFKHLDQGSDILNMREMLRHMSSEGSIISNAEEDLEPSPVHKRTRDESVRIRNAVLNLEGYLEVEKDEFLSNVGANFIALLKFESKYFNLKRDILYYYKDKASENAQGFYKVKEIVEFGPYDDDIKMFYITIKGSKEGETHTIRFKANTQDRRDAWLAGLKLAGTLPDDGFIELTASEINLFKDNRPLFVDIEEMPILEFPRPPGPPIVTAPTTRGAAASVSQKAVEKPIEVSAVDSSNPRRKSFGLDESDAPNVASTLQVEKEKKCCDSCAMF